MFILCAKNLQFVKARGNGHCLLYALLAALFAAGVVQNTNLQAFLDELPQNLIETMEQFRAIRPGLDAAATDRNGQ